MAFQFPDPNSTSEFTGANGVVYSYDSTDGKWVVKSSPFQGDYVKRTGGDEMEGPFKVLPNPDIPSSRDARRIETYGVFSGSESTALRLGTSRDRVYIGHDDTSFNGLVKIDQIGEKNAGNSVKFQNDIKMGVNQIKNLAEGTDDKDAVTYGQLKQELFTNPSDTTTNKYVSKTGDSMSGDLNITSGKKIEFSDIGPNQTALRLVRNSSDYVKIAELTHNGDSNYGGYDIRVQGNTNYNELRLMGGSNADTKFFSFKANGKTDFYTDVSFNTHKITDLADGTDLRDAVTVEQLSSLTGQLDFNINVLTSTQKSIRAG